MNQEFKDTLIQSLKNDSVSIINSPVYKKVGLYFHNMLLNSKGLLSYLYECLNSKVEKYIKLPHYINFNKRKLRSTEFILRENGKYGILLNIISNRKTFNFSVRLRDMTIIHYDRGADKQIRGSYRSFTLTDMFGNISNNWRTLKVLDSTEKKKIFDNHDKHEIKTYDCFIDDDMGKQLFSDEYYAMKCIIKRLEAERKYWEECKERAQDRLITYDAEYELRKAKETIDEVNNEE